MVSNSSFIMELILAVIFMTAILLFMGSRFFRFSNRIMAVVSAAVLLIAAACWLFQNQIQESPPATSVAVAIFTRKSTTGNAFFQADNSAKLMSILTLVTGFVVSVYNTEYLSKEQRQHAFYPLMLIMLVGIIGMVWAADLLIVYLFSELMNICAYALVAFRRKNNMAIEAGFKYLMMSSAASVVVLAGISILFYTEGTVLIRDITIGGDMLSSLGALLLLGGFSLKSAIVPLHTWLPDAHGKAPSSISALLSGVLVQSVFYVMVRITLSIGFSPILLGNLILIFSVMNIIVGNLMGIIQKNLKRMLGYSTIAQMGYIALCFAIGLRNGSVLALQSGFFIIIAHAVTKGLAFLEAGTFYLYEGLNDIKEIRSLKNHPLFTIITLTLAIMSLSAIPPFPGFTGKWIALTSVFATNDPLAPWITMIFLTGSLIAFGYYLPLLVNLSSLFIRDGNKIKGNEEEKKISFWMKLPAIILVMSVALLIITPQFIFNSTLGAAEFMLEMIR